MKALRSIIITLFLTAIATSAFAATLSHAPGRAYVVVPAGSSAAVSVTVSISDVRGTYYLWYVDAVEGSLPKGWIRPAKKTAFLSPFWTSASTNIVITVPGDAKPGLYSSYVHSKAMRSHNYADPGPGMLIEVLVPSGCAAAPHVEISGFGPDVIWPPNHSMQAVTVSGTVNVPAGCTLYEAGYSIADEYGIYTGVGRFTVSESGEFAVPIPVEAWRDGQDKDGRHYTIKLFAEDDAGIGTSDALEVVVPHDKGKRPNQEYK